MAVYIPQCISQTKACSNIVMSDRLLQSEQASWSKVLPLCADQSTFLRALRLLWCHHGEALCDPAGHLLYDGLGHFWEVVVKGVVASLVHLNRSNERSGQTGRDARNNNFKSDPFGEQQINSEA